MACTEEGWQSPLFPCTIRCEASFLVILSYFLTHEDPHLLLSKELGEDAGDGETHVDVSSSRSRAGNEMKKRTSNSGKDHILYVREIVE